MKVQMVGFTHHEASIAARERLAFSPDQVCAALSGWRRRFPNVEAVLISTCNRMELYAAAEDADDTPSREVVAAFLADFHDVPLDEIIGDLIERSGKNAIEHLFAVSASLDSMVLGEPQILSQVKEAYERANEQKSTGPLTHSIFQAAVRVARRVATETAIHRRRVSVPSVAVADVARSVFERFDDKKILVLGAGEMADETLRYLHDEGARHVTVINRHADRAHELAGRWQGTAGRWEARHEAIAEADLVVSTTGAGEPIVTLADYCERVEPHRYQRPLVVLDLAIPRDFDPEIGNRLGVYLQSIDDLKEACEQNRKQRDRDLPAAQTIVEEETGRFMTDWYHRATAPTIALLRQGWSKPKDEELERLLRKLPDLDEHERKEIAQSFDRLVNKLLHPPLESLRFESQHGPPHGLLDALRRLFQITE